MLLPGYLGALVLPLCLGGGRLLGHKSSLEGGQGSLEEDSQVGAGQAGISVLGAGLWEESRRVSP